MGVHQWGIGIGFGRGVYPQDEALMLPAILIIEPRREVADALQELVMSANYLPIVRPRIQPLVDLGFTPAAIIVRVAFEGISEPPHAAIADLPLNRPPVIAIAWSELEIAEAQRVGCNVILRAPDDVSRLLDMLTKVVHAA
jgi:hypothetical protein